jgi:hypothetical protein
MHSCTCAKLARNAAGEMTRFCASNLLLNCVCWKGVVSNRNIVNIVRCLYGCHDYLFAMDSRRDNLCLGFSPTRSPLVWRLPTELLLLEDVSEDVRPRVVSVAARMSSSLTSDLGDVL